MTWVKWLINYILYIKWKFWVIVPILLLLKASSSHCGTISKINAFTDIVLLTKNIFYKFRWLCVFYVIVYVSVYMHVAFQYVCVYVHMYCKIRVSPIIVDKMLERRVLRASQTYFLILPDQPHNFISGQIKIIQILVYFLYTSSSWFWEKTYLLSV